MRVAFIRMGFHEGGFYQEGLGLSVLLVIVEGARDFKTSSHWLLLTALLVTHTEVHHLHNRMD